MALPKEPRQKMINLMYLVLTALLALNVSSEVLNAFKIINSSLIRSNRTLISQSLDKLNQLQQLSQDPKNEERAKIWYPIALKTKQMTDSLIHYLDSIKLQIKLGSGGDPNNNGEGYRIDNLDAPTRILVNRDIDNHRPGEQIRTKLMNYLTNILSLNADMKRDLSSNLAIDLSFPNGKSKKNVDQVDDSNGNNADWAWSYFHFTPSIAAVTIITKFENDVSNTEDNVLDYCLKSIGQVNFIIDQYSVFANTNSQYILAGQPLIIHAGLASFSSAAKPIISINGQTMPVGPDGTAILQSVPTIPGDYKANVQIQYVNQITGQTETKDVSIPYTVGQPTGVFVSADAVKVLYVGLDNPISISGGGGVGAEQLNATISQGSLTKLSDGRYIANVSAPGEAVIGVRIGNKNSSFRFRVKNVPPPIPKVGVINSGRVASNLFKSQVGLRADLENFVFEGVKFNVQSYVMVFSGKGFDQVGPQIDPVNGAYFSGKALQDVNNCRPGSSIIITDVVVSGPGGTRKLDGSIAFYLTN